jgi:FG-GAP repeat
MSSRSHWKWFQVVLCVVPFATLTRDRAPAPAPWPSSEAALPDELTAADWSGIRAACEARRYALTRCEDGHRAGNPGQRWTTRFDGRGFTIEGAGWSWGLELVRWGFVGRERAVSGEADASVQGRRLTYAWDAELSEWYANDARGLEHGYTVLDRPTCDAEGKAGPLTFTLAVRGGLRGEVQDGALGARFSNGPGAAVLTYAGLSVLDAEGRSLPGRMECTGDGLRLSVDERGARYPLTVDPVAQQAYLKASNTDALDLFGVSVSVSGDTVVVGAPLEDSSATGVNGDQGNGGGAGGAAYVFVRSGSGWSQQAYLKASNTDLNDQFGRSVAISGDTLVVGAIGEDSHATGVDGDQSANDIGNSGAAYVFVRSGTSWSQQAYLKASNTGLSDAFGVSASISGDTLVIGAYLEDSNATGVDGDQVNNGAADSGAAYVFVRNGTSWSQQAYLKASNTEGGDWFGGSVSISGDTLVVGAHMEDSSAVGVDGDQGDNGAGNSGAAYVFLRSGTSWSQQAYLKASNTGADDGFGLPVAVSADTVVVGAADEDSNATGVDGDQGDNSAVDSGAAYVFVRSGATWSQQAYLKASNTDAGDSFGFSTSIADETVVVGAELEDSSATGVDGDPSDNSAGLSGAAYVFSAPFARSFCDASDGALASCPCSNAGLPETGCDIQQGTGGVGLALVAQQTTPQNRVTWQGTGFPTTATPTSIVIRAASLDSASPVVFGDGIRCIGTPLVRLAATFASGGTAIHTHGHGTAAGSGDFYYQLWFRNQPIMYCDPAAAYNLSNGRILTW